MNGIIEKILKHFFRIYKSEMCLQNAERILITENEAMDKTDDSFIILLQGRIGESVQYREYSITALLPYGEKIEIIKYNF